jgi:glycosyltransferase involved in cell wall biosynthesis
MLKIPLEWILFVGILFLLVLFFDQKPTDQLTIAPKTQSALLMWNHIEPPETRIRMLWIIHSYVPYVNAGSEVCAHTINKYLMSMPYKYDIWVACPGFPKQSYEGVRCFDLYDTTTLQKVLSTTHVLHSHSYVYRNQMCFLSRKTGIPFVEWVHTDNYIRAIPRWEDPRIRARHWTVFNSSSLMASCKGYSKQHCRILNPPVDYRQYGLLEADRNPVYVTLSNVNENKGGKLLIALARAMPDLQFQGILGGYRTQIVEESIPNLRYIQNTTEIRDVYAQTWVLIMPSREETWGRSAVEAMASGIPVIAAKTPGLLECCDSAAIFCDREDPEAWISTLRRLKSDKQFYNARSTAAFERARALDPQHTLQEWEEWLSKEVVPSKQESNTSLSSLEYFLLFR